VLLTGAQQPAAQGMAGWLKRRRRELDPAGTVILNLDGIGEGGLTYARREGAVFARPVHRQLSRLCAEVAEDGAHGATPRTIRQRTDAAAAAARGLPAVTISSAGTMLDPAAVDRAHDFCRELAQRLDAEVGPRLAEAGDLSRSSASASRVAGRG